MPVTALGTLCLLAACGSKEATPAAGEDLAAQVADKQAELQQLESELAAQQAADTTSKPPVAQGSPAPRPAASSKPASTASASPAPKPAASTPVVVPQGTTLSLSLATALSSKSAKVGDTVRAVLTEGVMVDGRTAITAGTTVAGSVIKVVSGSDKIGGTPTLVVAFDRLELAGGVDVPISGEFAEQGKSDNTRDTVKIVGGAAAGVLIGDQVSKKDKGKVIGGLLGAAAGAVAAQKTGTEVQLAEGTALSLMLTAPVQITK